MGFEFPAPRELLRADRTYFVSTAGNDANNGLSSGTAFLTVQHAVDVVTQTLDFAYNTVTIQVADGTYNESVSVYGQVANQSWDGTTGTSTVGILVIQGNAGTPANVVINGNTGNHTLNACHGAVLRVKDLTLRAQISLGNLLNAQTGAHILFTNLVFGTVSAPTITGHIGAEAGGTVSAVGNYTVAASAAYHWYSLMNGNIYVGAVTITLTGTPAFSVAFAFVDSCGTLSAGGITFSGSATGVRYLARQNGFIYTAGAAATYFPGDQPGYTQSDGQLDTSGYTETLGAARTYYVATTGNDANTGLDSSHAFKTIQKAVNVAQTLNFNGFQVTIQLADGTYAENVSVQTLIGCVVGVTGLVITGNAVTPTNVVVAPASGNAIFNASNSGSLTVQNLAISTTAGIFLYASYGAITFFTNVSFGTGTGASIHIQSSRAAKIVAFGNYGVTGGGTNHVYTTLGGLFECRGKTITMTNGKVFTTWAACDTTGIQVVDGNTYSSGATGARYSVTLNGVVNTVGGGANYFPGNSAGSTGTGGQYA